MALSAWLEGRFGSKRLTRLAMLAYASMLVVVGFCHTPLLLGMALLALGSLGNVTSICVNTQGVLAEKRAERPISNWPNWPSLSCRATLMSGMRLAQDAKIRPILKKHRLMATRGLTWPIIARFLSQTSDKGLS